MTARPRATLCPFECSALKVDRAPGSERFSGECARRWTQFTMRRSIVIPVVALTFVSTVLMFSI